MTDAVSQRPEYVRVRELLPLLLRMTAVLFPECGQWVVQAREHDQAAQGSTRAKAILAFEMSFTANVLLHVRPDVAQCPACPDYVWAYLIAREGAEVLTFGFHQYSGEAQSVGAMSG